MNEYMKMADRMYDLSNQFEQLKMKNENLEKENAELRDKLNKIERKCKFNFVDLLHDVENESKQEEQLTKAIGIIKRWYETNRSACIEPSQELIEVTEQFLKEQING